MKNHKTDAVVAVGAGRGFLIETAGDRMVITAAHCLPHLPPPHPAMFTEERTYPNLLGPLGGPATIWAECVFVDPIADVAMLRKPDGQTFFDQADEYDSFVQDRAPISLAEMPQAEAAVIVLTLNGEWSGARALSVSSWSGFGGCVALDMKVLPGMSGSPILLADGRAVAIVSCDRLHPALASQLPAWLWRQVMKDGAV